VNLNGFREGVLGDESAITKSDVRNRAIRKTGSGGIVGECRANVAWEISGI